MVISESRKIIQIANVTLLCYHVIVMVSSQHEETLDLISKKEILEKFEITYGQFYRWKRKGLIPEAWFIRKSTYTGQETFLPREKISERITTIMDLKANHSLEEIAELLSPESSKTTFHSDDLTKDLFDLKLIETFEEMTGNSGPFAFWDVLRMSIFAKLEALSLDLGDIQLAIDTLDHDYAQLDGSEIDWTLWLVRKKSGPSICCVGPKNKLYFDPETDIAAEIDLEQLMDETRVSLRRL